MALQQCLSGGRKMLMTNLPGCSSHIRHLFWSGTPVGTQKWNRKNTNYMLMININRSPNSSSTKWLCIKTCRHDYSQLHKGRGGRESSENRDDDERDGDEDDYDGNDDEKEEEDVIDKQKIKAQVEDIFAKKKEMSSAEWKDMIELMALENSSVTARSCDAITMKKCLRHGNYHLGTSYLHHLEQEGREPNLSTLGSYLQLCGEQVDQCGEARVLEYYHRLMNQAKVLDLRLMKNAIVGVAMTQEWRRALDLLPRHRKISAVCSEVYSAIITAALRAGDCDLAWQLFDTMRQEGQDPKDAVILEWVRQCDVVEDRAQKETMLLTLLHKLEAFETFPSVAVAKEVTRLCREGLGWSAHYLKMPRSGRCPACKHQLEIKVVNEEEFRQLQEEFVPRVLMGSDIFRSTNPEEWQDFQRFVERRRPFSVVVDGLNVSYIVGKKSDSSRQQSLRDVVEQALAQHPGSRVLVLGRQHMRKWVTRMRWDTERVCFFTLNNMSKDDGFFLHAALQSGLGTKFITSDMLRDHLFRLRERHLQDTFRRWQRTHQVMAFSSAGHARLLFPAKFSTVTQQRQQDQQEVEKQQQQSSGPQSCVLSSWHVPYDDGKPRQSYELPTTWLCLHPTLSLSPPLPASVSLDPQTYTSTNKPDATLSNHGSDTAQGFLQRHHHRLVSPMNDWSGGALVHDCDMYDNFAKKGRPQRRQNRWVDDRAEEGPGKSVRLSMSENDDASLPPVPLPSSPPKSRKRFVHSKKSSLRIGEVDFSAIFDKDKR